MHIEGRLGRRGRQNPRNGGRGRQQGDRRENFTDSQSRAEEIVSRGTLELAPAWPLQSCHLAGLEVPLAAARTERRGLGRGGRGLLEKISPNQAWHLGL